MIALQITFIALTLLAPFAWSQAARRWRSERFERLTARALAVILVTVEVGGLAVKVLADGMPVRAALPMHLCDWALFAVAGALWWRGRTCFEVAYFWGLAGTTQALITPAIGPETAPWRIAMFFLAHSGIVIGVFFLLLVPRLRPVPGSLVRAVIWSEIYLATALLVNAWTGENYGFLSAKPANPSLLEWFSDTRWLYVAQINLTAVIFFLALYAPWFVRARRLAGRGRSLSRQPSRR